MHIGPRQFDLADPVIIGIINVTPDSFSDGGLYNSPARAAAHARCLIDEGADILDIGGESTRPGSKPVSAREEIRRVCPVIEAIRAMSDIPISIDTRKADVARAALDVGAHMINDISAGRDDAATFEVAASAGVVICLMHMKGTPATMQIDPRYENDVLSEIRDFLADRIDCAVAAGIDPSRIIIDPGIGFGKSVEDNIKIIMNIEQLLDLHKPILIGTSRKSFMGKLLGCDLDERLEPTLATISKTFEKGVRFFRVHEPGATRRYLAMVQILSESVPFHHG